MGIAVEAPTTSEEKRKAANQAVVDIDKEYGKGSIFNMGARVHVDMPHIATGLFEVDNEVLGIGGLPRGRIIEAYGPESGGKTTFCLTVIAQVQRQGGLAAIVDAENALDPKWASKLGVNVDDLFVSQPDSGEEALEITERLISSGAFDVVVVDSVAALVPKAELEGDMGSSHMGLQARLMSQAMRKLTGITRKTNTTLIFINQIRSKIGVVYGNPEVTTGGRALQFYASVRLDVRRTGPVKDGEIIIGNKVRIKGAKNKVSAPFREAEVDLLFESGFDGVGSLFDAAVECKVVEKSGSWFSKDGERLGQGRNNAKLFLEDPTIYQSVYDEVVAARKGQGE